MHPILARVTSLAALLAAAGSMGCSPSSTGGSSSSSCNANPSFSKDVIAAFATSCSLTGVCHGQIGNLPEESLYLGMSMGGGTADVQAVYSGLVGVASKENPSMNLVTKADLQNSFLWHKVNDDQATLNSGPIATGCMKAGAKCQDCTSMEPCGATMPYGGYMLANPNGNPQALCTIQNWIMQGAQDN